MRRISAVCLWASMTGMLSGCVPDGTGKLQVVDVQTEKPQQSFSITYVGGDIAHKQGITTVISDFEKSHPNITIHEINETTLYGEQFLKMKDAVHEFPDLMEMLWTDEFVQAGLIAELPADVAALLGSVPAFNGKIYNAPLDLPAPQGIIYNKKLFREAGIQALPVTLEEFLLDCEKIKQMGISPLVVGGKDLWHMGFWVNKFLIDDILIQNPDWNYQRTQGEVSWTDSGPKLAFQSLKKLWDKGYVTPDYRNISDYQTAAILASGKAAMLFSGPWMFNQVWAIDPNFELGFFALPDENGKVNMAGASTPSGWSISNEAAQNDEKLEMIKQFLHFFFSADEYAKYLQIVNGIPSTKETITYPTSDAMKELLRVMNDPATGLSRHMNGFWGKNEYPPHFLDWFYTLIQDYLAGKISLDQAMQEADQEWNQEMKELQSP